MILILAMLPVCAYAKKDKTQTESKGSVEIIVKYKDGSDTAKVKEKVKEKKKIKKVKTKNKNKKGNMELLEIEDEASVRDIRPHFQLTKMLNMRNPTMKLNCLKTLTSFINGD